MPRLGILSIVVGLTLAACGGDTGGKTGGTDTGSTDPGTVDNDNDGYPQSEDCNDSDGTVNPGATEVCDGIDNDCDDSVDEDVQSTFYKDGDGDGFGDPATTDEACEKPPGFVPNGNDCDDANAESYPGNTEVCDGIDNDCDTEIDEDVTTRYYADSDLDSYGDPASYVDACSQPSGYVADNTDCDDTSAQAFPDNLEVCDEIDNDCDGSVDEGVTSTYYADTDGDTYGDETSIQEACSLPTGYSTIAGDCDDTSPTTHPGADEYCNGVDDNCDGTADEDTAVDASTWYADSDTDGYGDSATSKHQCYQPTGYVADATDCDDASADVNPGATEYCNGIDDDCDGTTDENDAADAADWYADSDHDGYGNASTSAHQCSQPSGYVADATDCDDTHATVYPGAPEYCDGLDNDCDGDVDEDGDVVDGTTYYADSDIDGLGDPDTTIDACSAPSGYADNAYDCDDVDASEPVVVDKSSGSSGGAGTLADPFDAIQDGIDTASECVIVYAGTYRENIDLSGVDLDVWGVEGEDYTFIDPNDTPCSSAAPTGCAPAVTVAGGGGASPTLHGFTISGGTGYTSSSTTTTTCADSSASHGGNTNCTVTTYEYCGGGVYIAGDDPIFSDLIITENLLPEFEQTAVGSFTQYWLYSYGGGVCVKGGAPEFNNVHVYENFADQGGGVYVADSGVLTHNHSVLAENTASDGGAFNIDGGELSATNAIVAFNAADTDGGGIFTQNAGLISLVNDSMAYNDSASGTTRGDSIYVSSGTTAAVMNSILHGDSTRYVVYAAGTWSGSYNDTYNTSSGGTLGGTATAGTGSISSAPSWTKVTDDGNYNNDDWSLKSTSPCIDAGDPSTAYNDTDGTANDMGATGGPGGEW